MSELGKAIAKLSQIHGENHDGAHIYAATVNSVDIANRVCDVTTINGEAQIDLSGVLLMASVEDGLLLSPAVDSVVIVCNTENLQPFVMMYSKVDSLYYVVGDAIFKMDGTKFNIKNSTQSLATIMADFINVLAAMTFTNGAGTTSVADNVTDINAIGTRLNALLV